MAVYDDQKTKPGEHDDLGVPPEKRKAEVADLEKSFGAPDAVKPEKSLGSDQLGAAEDDASNTIGGGFNSTDTSASFASRIRGQITRKRVIGGGITAGIVALIFGGLTFSSGPFQFIHIAQSLQAFHFSNQEDASDNRMTKIARYVTNNRPEKTRLNRLGNIHANAIEAKLNKSGIESGYNRLGYLDGYVIDPSSIPEGSEVDNLVKNKSPTEASAALKEHFGVDVNFDSSKNVFHMSADDLNYRSSKKLVRSMLQAAGYTKLGATLDARIMGKRAGISWHPMRKLDKSLLESIDARLEAWRKARQDSIEKGAGAEIDTATPTEDANGDGNPDPPTQDATEAQAKTNDTIKEGTAAHEDLQTGTPSSESNAFKSLRESTSAKFAGGIGAAIGVACTIKGLSDNYDNIKQSQVVLPLMRLGMEAVTTGNQVMSGKDVDLEQLGFLAKQLYSKDSGGSWAAAKSIQAEQGQPLNGPDIRDEAKVDTNGNIISQFMAQIPGLDPVCKAASSAVGQVASFGIDFIGGPFSAIASTAFSTFAAPRLLDGLVHWLAGNPIDVNVAGADYGNYINYGARLASNDTAISLGGSELSSAQVAELNADRLNTQHQEESTKSFAERMADPYDSNSLISQVMDKQNPDLGSNVTNTAISIMSLRNTVTSIPRVFSSLFSRPVWAAADTSYNYGFPKYGFSIEDLDNPAVKNPFDNGDKVSDLLNGPNGDSIASRVKTCFGMNISKDGTVTGGESVPSYKDINDGGANCKDGSLDWLRVRFYILDTETMEAVSCYEGQNDSCNNIGMGNSSTAPASNASNNNIYVIGDSITVGMRDYGGLDQKLTAKGWNVSKPIDAVGGKPLKWGIDTIKTRTDLTNVGTVVIGLGTNDGGTNNDTFAKEVDDMVAAVKQVAPNAKIRWTNLYGEGQLCALICVNLPEKFGQLNQILQQKSTQDGFTITPWATSDVAPKLVGNNDVHPSGHYPEFTDYIVGQIGDAPK